MKLRLRHCRRLRRGEVTKPGARRRLAAKVPKVAELRLAGGRPLASAPVVGCARRAGSSVARRFAGRLRRTHLQDSHRRSSVELRQRGGGEASAAEGRRDVGHARHAESDDGRSGLDRDNLFTVARL